MPKARPNGIDLPHASRARRLLSALGLAAAGGALSSGCLERPVCAEDCAPRTTNLFVDAESQRSIDKIDLLFMIDNSSSMADKQEIFAKAVPDLVRRLVSPACVLRGGGARLPGPPPPAGAPCPEGYEREFRAVRDIHIGVITSSLGGYGGARCNPAPGVEHPLVLEEANDRGHLVGSRGRFASFLAGATGAVQDVTAEGFLDWSPGKGSGQDDPEPLITAFQAMTRAADEHGCGYEASLEAVYRFLSDPKPPLEVRVVPCGPGRCSEAQGVDTELLAQREAFLRPDSLVAVILLSDENDCSIQMSPYGFLATTDGATGRGTAVCETNPNDPCCYSCNAAQRPDGCPEAPECASPPSGAPLPNIACHEQKRRFGHDFLYPTRRYVNALTEPRFCASLPDLAPDEARCGDADGDGRPDMVDNPLLVSKAGLRRDLSLVFLAGIVGVPWQDLRAPADAASSSLDVLRYKTASEMRDDGTWDVILGNPAPGRGAPPIRPRDTLMVESVYARAGDAAEGTIIAGPDASRLANPINGHEWETLGDDLQYACVFPLPQPTPCPSRTGAGSSGDAPRPFCDCGDLHPDQKNPLCQAPDGTYGTTQYFAKAYPGLRQLQVLEDFGERSIVASICAKELGDDSREDYGYRPAVEAIVDRLKATLGGRCLPRRLERGPDGKLPCSIVEASPAPGATCDPLRGRSAPRSGVIELARQRMAGSGQCGVDVEGSPRCEDYTFCELAEAGPECRDGKATPASVGYCYVDPEQNPGDDPALVEGCDPAERRILRFIDPEEQTPASGARILIACAGAPLE